MLTLAFSYIAVVAVVLLFLSSADILNDRYDGIIQ